MRNSSGAVCEALHRALPLRRGVFLVVGLAFLAAASGVQAQDVRGRVIDPAAEPLNFAQVRLLPLDRRATTGSNGTFNLGAIPPGTYTLRIRRLGFQAVMQSITVPLATSEVIVIMTPVPVMLDTVHTELLKQELPYVFQRRQEHLGAAAFGPDLMKTYPGMSLDEILHADGKLWQQLAGAQFFGCQAKAYIDGHPTQTPLRPNWALALSPSSNPASANTSAVDFGLAGQVRMRDVAAVEVLNSPDFVHEPDLAFGPTSSGAHSAIRECTRIVMIWTNGYTQPRGPDSTMHGHPQPLP